MYKYRYTTTVVYIYSHVIHRERENVLEESRERKKVVSERAEKGELGSLRVVVDEYSHNKMCS